jgi:anti-anti-sigma factor
MKGDAAQGAERVTAMALTMTARDGRWYVQGEMTIYCAAQLKEQLFSAVRERSGIAGIDLSGVTELDTAGVQVLLLARRMSAACGTQLTLVAASAAVREVLELAGLTQLLASTV